MREGGLRRHGGGDVAFSGVWGGGVVFVEDGLLGGEDTAGGHDDGRSGEGGRVGVGDWRGRWAVEVESGRDLNVFRIGYVPCSNTSCTMRE